VDGFRGQGLINSYLNGDQTRGTLTSPEFEVNQDYISFLIGGGNHPGRTGICLMIDGRTVRIATGDNAERLSWKSWNVREFKGSKARIEVFDQETGGWGHINVDHIVMADKPATPAAETALWADYGPDFYAAVSWSDIPKRDGRRLWLGWMSGWPYAGDVPTSPWRSAMSLPRELTLHETKDGVRMVQQPVEELRNIRGERVQKRNATVAEANEWLKERNIAGPLWEIEAEIEVENGAGFGLKLFSAPNQATTLNWDGKTETLTLDRTRSGKVDFNPQFSGRFQAPLKAKDGKVRLHLFLDTSSIEVFGNDGETAVTALVFPSEQSFQAIQFESSDSRLKIDRIRVWKLQSAVPIK